MDFGNSTSEESTISGKEICGDEENLEKDKLKELEDCPELILAIDEDRTEDAKELARNLDKVRVKDSSGQTPLMRAAINGNLELLKIIAKTDPSQFRMQNKNGETALMLLAGRFTANLDCLTFLLEEEGGMQDEKGWTALILALLKGYENYVELLAEKEFGMTFLFEVLGGAKTSYQYAKYIGNWKCAEIIKKAESKVLGQADGDSQEANRRSGCVGCIRVETLYE